MAVTLNALPFELPVTRPEISEVTDFTIHSPERMTMTVSTEDDALLTLAIVDYPGWQATIDGEPVEIVDVHAGLIGIPIRAGMEQTVELRFVSETVNQGAAISLGTLIVVMLLGGIGGWRERRASPPGEISRSDSQSPR
jgi:uncharacterized membrane protein YfhO